MIGAASGAGLVSGVWLLLSAWRRNRRPSLEQRLLPYVRDVHPVLHIHHRNAAAAIFGPLSVGLATRIGEVLGGDASVARRLQRAGSSDSIADFRMKQLVWGLLGFGLALVPALLIWRTRQTGAAALLILCVSGAVLGPLARDRWLSRCVKIREAEMIEEFPAVADLLALTVAAGESPASGLARVAGVCGGALSRELDRVLAEIRTGSHLSTAFDAMARRTGVATIARFAEGLAVATERGTPLIEVLHAQAADVRESNRRQLIETGGRKDLLMMIPVVFLILPVTVLFAFFPAAIGLRLTV